MDKRPITKNTRPKISDLCPEKALPAALLKPFNNGGIEAFFDGCEFLDGVFFISFNSLPTSDSCAENSFRFVDN